VHDKSWIISTEGAIMSRQNQNGKKKLSIKEKQNKKKEKIKRKMTEQKPE
jgi:hypothetical protein